MCRHRKLKAGGDLHPLRLVTVLALLGDVADGAHAKRELVVEVGNGRIAKQTLGLE